MKNQNNKKVNWRIRAALLVAVAIIVAASARALTGARSDGAIAPKPVSSGTPTTSGVEVKIDNFAFTPNVATVKVGTELIWTNHDDIPHTVDSTQGKFKSAALDTGDKFQFRFTEAGEYPFYCRIHPKMTGKIVVQP